MQSTGLPPFVPLIRWLAAVILLAVWCGPRAEARPFNAVIIDAGHGAHDFGAQSGYLFEKHLALDISRRLERALRRQGLRTVMTRGSDRFIPLDTRAAMGNAYGGAVFVSIHINSASRSSASGLETFYHSREGSTLASLVQRAMLSGTNHGGNRGVKHANFRVLRNSRVPAILVETGFISNGSDRRRLRDPAYREAIARCIATGLLQYRRR